MKLVIKRIEGENLVRLTVHSGAPCANVNVYDEVSVAIGGGCVEAVGEHLGGVKCLQWGFGKGHGNEGEKGAGDGAQEAGEQSDETCTTRLDFAKRGPGV